jgi:P2 family phage contractile tail tube protein
MSSATDFTASTIIATLSGLITTSEPGDLKPGTKSTLKVVMDVQTYKLELDGEVIFDIDLVNARRVIGGVDQLAELRRAMGV